MKRVPGRPHKVDRQLLHEYLWDTRTRYNYVAFSQGDLAEHYGVTQATMSLIMKEMIEAGRLENKGKRWIVFDPSIHRWEYTPSTDTLF